MDGTGPAYPGEEPGDGAVRPPRLAVIMGRPADADRVCRVDAPDRVLRIWGILSSAGDELHKASLSPEAVARLHWRLQALTAELKRSLSPALASELHHLVNPIDTAVPTADELRVEYAALLAWTASLVIGILTQIEAASARTPGQGFRPQRVAR